MTFHLMIEYLPGQSSSTIGCIILAGPLPLTLPNCQYTLPSGSTFHNASKVAILNTEKGAAPNRARIRVAGTRLVSVLRP